MPVDKLCSFYTHFNASKIPDLGEIYDAKVAFVDPLHKVDGLPALKAYFSHLCDDQGQYRFAITHKLVNQNQGFIRWVMHYSHPKLASGKPLQLVGGSLLHFDQRITAQEDFYDMGAMVYQHIPLLGWAVRKVNHHLSGVQNA